jgi:hypothetical protein
VVGNAVSMKIASICKGGKNLIKVRNMHYFFEGVNFAYWSLGAIC